jgi:hypothetical protein
MLVMHARGDLRVSFEEGRALAAMIPNARFVLARERGLGQRSRPL